LSHFEALPGAFAFFPLSSAAGAFCSSTVGAFCSGVDTLAGEGGAFVRHGEKLSTPWIPAAQFG